MRGSLYCAKVSDFVEGLAGGALPRQIARNFLAVHGYSPSESEITSWQKSWPALGKILDDAKIPDAAILLEYRLPLSSARVDCVIAGSDPKGNKHTILVELKQWATGRASETPDCVSIFGQDVLHPSAQVLAYGDYLENCHSAFVAGETRLLGCAYMHNLGDCQETVFCSAQYSDLLQRAPVFSRITEEDFSFLLRGNLSSGCGLDVARFVDFGAYSPSRSLLENAARAIRGESVWKLIDNQLKAFHVVLKALRDAAEGSGRACVVVTGGPGTGKSVIALQLFAEAARRGAIVVHATGSKAFTTNMRGLVGKGDRSIASLFKYFNDFSHAEPRSIDLVICDEAHRLRETSSTRWKKSTTPQVDEIVAASKASVFFLDQNQAVRPGEVGTVELIQRRAQQLGASVKTVELDTQFRCAGSESYLLWLEGLLGFRTATPSAAWRDEFDLQICDAPEAMEADLRSQIAKGFSARMVAGFCWPWSDPVKGQRLPPDVVIQDWKRPWNEKPSEMMGGSQPPPHRHPYTLWANQPEGFGQIGCIYSAQGFEFDYVGVIWGEDLVWREGRGWIGNPEKSSDKVAKRGASRDRQQFTTLLRQTYRVLLSRGMKGCRLVCIDPETRARIKIALNPQNEGSTQ